MIKAVIFDLGGVVARDNPKAALSRIEFKGVRWDLALKGRIREEEVVKVIARKHGVKTDKIIALLGQRRIPNLEVIKLVKRLKKQYKLALVSNTLSSTFRYRIKHYDLEKYFDVLICSAEVGLLKPDPKIFQLALQKLNVNPEEAVLIDDREANIKSVETLGMKGILYEEDNSLIRELRSIGIKL